MEEEVNNKVLLDWIDGLSKCYSRYENQPSTENLSMLLGYISSSTVVKGIINPLSE